MNRSPRKTPCSAEKRIHPTKHTRQGLRTHYSPGFAERGCRCPERWATVTGFFRSESSVSPRIEAKSFHEKCRAAECRSGRDLLERRFGPTSGLTIRPEPVPQFPQACLWNLEVGKPAWHRFCLKPCPWLVRLAMSLKGIEDETCYGMIHRGLSRLIEDCDLSPFV